MVGSVDRAFSYEAALNACLTLRKIGAPVSGGNPYSAAAAHGAADPERHHRGPRRPRRRDRRATRLDPLEALRSEQAAASVLIEVGPHTCIGATAAAPCANSGFKSVNKK